MTSPTVKNLLSGIVGAVLQAMAMFLYRNSQQGCDVPLINLRQNQYEQVRNQSCDFVEAIEKLRAEESQRSRNQSDDVLQAIQQLQAEESQRSKDQSGDFLQAIQQLRAEVFQVHSGMNESGDLLRAIEQLQAKEWKRSRDQSGDLLKALEQLRADVPQVSKKPTFTQEDMFKRVDGFKKTLESFRDPLKYLNYFTSREGVIHKSGQASTFGEDLMIHRMFFSGHDKTDGSFKFLELGADDGFVGSNTLFFERERQWTGFLIEPFGENGKKIRKERDLTKAALASPMAVCRSKGNSEYVMGGQSGFAIDTTSQDHLKKVFKCEGEDCNNPELKKREGVTDVPCDTLGGIIRDLNGGSDPTIIHFWSLDCEGCENVALETFNWDNTSVAVIQVELEKGRSCGGDIGKCQDILRGKGFEFWMLSVGGDEIWYSKEYFQHYKVPEKNEDWKWVLERSVRDYFDSGNQNFHRWDQFMQTNFEPVTNEMHKEVRVPAGKEDR